MMLIYNSMNAGPAKKVLTIGNINYANLFPIFYMLQKKSGLSNYRFVEGVPSEINRLIREGKIDISPSSSIEYLRHKDRYAILEGHSISSIGRIGSILLFSKKPIDALSGFSILASSQSETSVALLDIILKKFYSVVCRLKTSDIPLSEALKSHTACLLIGDDALRAAARCKKQAANKHLQELPCDPPLFVYDLGDVWHKNTGLPFVFALWIARKNIFIDARQILEKFKADIDDAKDMALKNLRAIAAASDLRDIMTEDEIVSYWRGISYDFDDKHRRGLELFRSYAEEAGLIRHEY